MSFPVKRLREIIHNKSNSTETHQTPPSAATAMAAEPTSKVDKNTEKDAPASLLSLPAEILLENIIPRLSVNDIFSLSRTSRLLHTLCKDASVWRTKTETDFSFFSQQVALGSGTADAGWFERVYLGLKKPRTYLWGQASDARLGSAEDVAARTRATRFRFVRKVEQPMDVTDWFTKLPTGTASTEDSGEPPASIVDLQAGGWSFASRDSNGGVWVWGKLDGTSYRLGTDWSHPDTIVEHAARIPLPCSAMQIATGRRHLVVLDADNLIWEMKAWGKAYHHTAPALTAPSQTGAGTASRRAHISQIDAGWDISACLTATGDIHVWKPFHQAYNDALTPDDQLNGPLGTEDNRKLLWGTVRADAVDTLPDIPHERPVGPTEQHAEIEAKFASAEREQDWGEMSNARRTEALRVVQIACTTDAVLALRANGEVWAGSTSVGWEFLPHFSSPAITHISAQWANFFTYATSTRANPTSSVLYGWCENLTSGSGADLTPRPLAGLDDLHVIRVVSGDWHFAALTADGAMYTWGKNDMGQCGVPPGSMPAGAYDARDQRLTVPVRVGFPPDGDRPAFVFGITAAGMHTGALVLGHARGKDELPPIMPPREPDHDVDNERDALGSSSLRELGEGGMLPPSMFPAMRFRIGYAGRGMRRARGGGLGGRGTSRGGGPPE